MEIQIKKSIAEVYKIEVNGTWASITIESTGTASGCISIQSDYGNWSKSWAVCGARFKTFLTQLSMDYFAGKVGESDYLYERESIEQFKEGFAKALKEKEITKGNHAELLQELSDTYGYGRSIEHGVDDSEIIMNFMHDFSIDLVRGISPSFKNFWNKVWIPFAETLVAEEKQK